MVLEQKAYMLFYYRERRKPSSNKSFDVVHKQNASSTEIAKSYCGFGQESKETPSGQIEKVSGSISSGAVVQRNSSIGAVPGKPIIKDAPAECSTANKDSLVEHLSSRAGVECSLQKDSSANYSSLPPKDNCIIPTSNLKAVGVDTSVECGNHLNDASISDNVLKSVSGRGLCDSGAILRQISDCRNPQKGPDDAVAISTNCALLENCPRVAAEKAFPAEVYDLPLVLSRDSFFCL